MAKLRFLEPEVDVLPLESWDVDDSVDMFGVVEVEEHE